MKTRSTFEWFAVMLALAAVPTSALAGPATHFSGMTAGGARTAAIVAGADLTLDKRHSSMFLVGQNGTYALVVHNIGTTPTAGTTTVLDTLPAGLTYVPGTAPGWVFSTPSSQVVQADFAGSIAAGDSAGFALTVAIDIAAYPSVINSASADTVGDLDPTNNRDSDTTAIVVADLVIEKRHTAAFVVAEKGVYTIAVRNVGNGPTTNPTTVTDTLPAGLSNPTGSGTGWSVVNAGQVVTASFPGVIAAGDSAKFALTVDVLQAALPSVTNSASVTSLGDRDTTNNASTDIAAVTVAPDLTIDKRHTSTFVFGQTGTYTLVVTNVGSAATTDTAAVRDTLPIGLSFASGAGAGWVVSADSSNRIVTAKFGAAMAIGDSASFSLTVATAGQSVPSVTNAASVTTAGDANPANDRDTDPTTVITPDLSIQKAHIVAFTVGKNGSYTITVRNVGTLATYGAYTVTDTLPVGLTYKSFTGSGWSVTADTTGRLVTATRSSVLSPGVSSFLNITVAVGPAAYPSVTNRATVTGAGDLNSLNNRATDVGPVGGAPELSLDKRHTATFIVGQNAIYRFVVRNLGTAATSDTTAVRDTLPAGLTFVSGAGTGWLPPSANGQIVSFRYPGAIAGGDSASFDLTVSVGPAAPPAVTNAASVTTLNDYDPTDDRDLDPTPVGTAIDLSVDVRHTTSFTVGQTGDYTIVVENVGASSTTGSTTVRDTLPAGLTYVPGTSPGWTFTPAGQVLVADFGGAIAAGDSAKFTFTVSVSAAALPSVTNAATVSTAGDIDSSNDRDLDPTAVIGVPDLTIDVRHTTGFAAGQSGSYTIVVTNVGAGATTAAITVRDTLPAGLANPVGSGAGWSVSNVLQEVTASFGGVIAAGDSAKFTLTVNVLPAAAPSVTNFASVSGGGDSTPGNNRDGDPTAVGGAPDLTIDKRHITPFVVGQASDYTFVVTNVGSAPTVGAITVKDTMAVSLVSGGGAGTGWSVPGLLLRVLTATYQGVIAPGDSAQFSFTVTPLPAAAPGLTNFATVSGGGDASPANNRDADFTAIAGIPDLAFDKRHTAGFRVGLPGNYAMIVRNLGSGPTTGAVTVLDTLPAGLTYASSAGAGWSITNPSGQEVQAVFGGAIAAGDSAKFTLTVNVLGPAAPSVTNFATASGGGDVTPANNRDGDPTAVIGLPDLTIDLRHVGPFRLSNTGTYVIVVSNVGTGPSGSFITVQDTLPPGLTFLFAGGQGWFAGAAGSIVNATRLTPIAAGDSTLFTMVVTIDAAALPTVVNAATVALGGDVTPANNRDVDVVTITGQGLLAVTKRATPAEIDVGGVVDYAVNVINQGDGPVSGAEIADVLPTGLRYLRGTTRFGGVAAADPPGSPGPMLHFRLGTLLAGAQVDITYRVQVGPGSEVGSGVNRATASGFDSTLGRVTVSNTAVAAVRVRPGVFGDEGLIVGRVLVDCNCGPDHGQGAEDLGVPGVRLYLEDGTSAVTDAEGKYSFNHLLPRLHVVRVDESTLPDGARMVVIANRDAGSGVSQFVDLQRGELHRADFVEGSRSTAVLDAVKARRRAGEVSGPMYGSGGGGGGGANSGGVVDSSGVGAGGAPGSGGGGGPGLLALGLLNARIDWHGLNRARLDGASHDRFEDELRDLSHRSDDGRIGAGGRAAVFVSGSVADSVRVLFRYDSEHQPERRLFSDIRPDEGYQMVGDASVHGFDAQSASRLFARVERGASYAMYGDFATPSVPERALGAFSRRLNGGAGSLVLGPAQWGAFASQGHQHQVIDEFAAQGISGPYTLSRPDGTLGSELVEIVVRDRNQPAVILRRDAQVRFVDYTLEPFTGRLVFRHPIASLDEHLNPVSIRVTYESAVAGDAFWVYGGETRVTPFQALTVSGAVSRDEDPLAPRGLTSGDATFRLGSALTLTGEAARSDSGGTIGGGLKFGRASRVEAKVAYRKLSATLRALRTDINFDNPSSGLASGRDEQAFDLQSGLGRGAILIASGVLTHDLRTDGRRSGMQLGVNQTFPHGISAEGMWRTSEEGRIPASPLSPGTIPNKSNTLGGKLTLPMPWLKQSSAFVEGEQDVTWYNRHRFALGSDIRLTDKTRLFARHENVASLSGPFALNDFQQQEYTVVGLASDELRNGHVFTEYRLRDAAAGREALAAIGLRNRWALNRGLFADLGFERNIIVRGGSGAGTAVTGALEYTGSPLWKGTARAEWRRQDGSDQWLSGATMERKLSRDWAALGRTDLFRIMDVGRTDSRSQLGLAYRSTETNRLSALMRYDNRIENEDGLTPFRRVSHTVSSHANWQPATRLTLSGQLASKWAVDDHDLLVSRTAVKLLAGRALYDLTPRFDVGATGRSEFGGGHRFGVGGELGWLAVHNLRLATGYNIFGFRDSDMLGAARTDSGPYFDLGYKFDPFWGGFARDAK